MIEIKIDNKTSKLDIEKWYSNQWFKMLDRDEIKILKSWIASSQKMIKNCFWLSLKSTKLSAIFSCWLTIIKKKNQYH